MFIPVSMGRVWWYVPAVSVTRGAKFKAILGYKFEASLDYLARRSVSSYLRRG